VNCAAVPLDLFEAEFFGHRKGAFTGATRDRDGYFRVADKGTLFLDEIVCLPEAAQSKILRVLENGEFQKVGETRVGRVNVRLICATNVDLETEVKQRNFRQDLYYRINVFKILIPPLRERPEDIGILTQLFVKECSVKLNRRITRISPEVMQILQRYAWPGNVRELRNVVERAVILEKDNELTVGSLPDSLQTTADQEDRTNAMNLREGLAVEEKRILLSALQAAGGIRRQAAAFLGIDERNLSYYLKKHRLEKWRPE
jgi:transcriptional regulator with GAF, ATPase, and Fis domain